MPPRITAPDALTPVSELLNISEVTAGWLVELNIRTFGDLEKADLMEVWKELRVRHRQVTKLMYYALWGAVNNCHWNRTPDEEKARLSHVD